ncbi:MAG: BatD family protein [Filimonas sp.]|nr:BatD family protein [Filimonas sp.]
MLVLSATAKAQSCFVEISLDRTSVYVQQPFKITITVLTSTWYTAPLDFDNIQIPNAFILSFDRTTPGMFTVKGKQYAGLQFYFIVFPYKSGSFAIPSFNIVATTPPPGTAVANKIKLKTPARNFVVKPVPATVKGDNWFVAKNVYISEKWNRSLSNLKVGDVIERTITVNARGTLPQFIPELTLGQIDFASIYPQDADLADTRDDYDANGRRTQKIIYLLEKPGDFVIPAIPVQWWNPNSSKLYSRSVAAGKIHVAPNPNLGIVQTLKDSLNTTKAMQSQTKAKHGPRLFYGLPWYLFFTYVLIGLILFYFLTRYVIRLYRKIHAAYLAYLQSEVHWFIRFLRSSLQLPVIVNRLYAWWDRRGAASATKCAAVNAVLRNANEEGLLKEWDAYNKQLFREENTINPADKNFKKKIKAYRSRAKQIVHTSNEISLRQQPFEIT